MRQTRPGDDGPTRGEAPALRTALAALAGHTATPENAYAAVWKGRISGGPVPSAPRVAIPELTALSAALPGAVRRATYGEQAPLYRD